MEVDVQTIPLGGESPCPLPEAFTYWAREIFAPLPAATLFTWTTDFAYLVVIQQGPTPVCFLRIVDRTVLVDGQPLRIGGVADVMTPPEHRRKGLAGMALSEARRVVFQTLEARLGLLFCEPELVPFYGRYGWQQVDCPVGIDQPGGKIVWPRSTMILARPGETWRPQAIDACGLPW